MDVAWAGSRVPISTRTVMIRWVWTRAVMITNSICSLATSHKDIEDI
jgi:hypothetical protein